MSTRLTKKSKRERRKAGEHRMNYNHAVPRCDTCGMDEDDAFTAGHPCSYGKDYDAWYREVYGD